MYSERMLGSAGAKPALDMGSPLFKQIVSLRELTDPVTRDTNTCGLGSSCQQSAILVMLHPVQH